MTKDKALKLALEALELHGKQYPHMVKGYCLDAITAIKQARSAQQEHEPENEPFVSLASVQDTETHYKGVVEGVQKLFNDKRTQLVPEEDLYDLAVKADNWGQP